ncbi:HD domain-containing protein [Acidobacteria bacterium AB60]|nr:HD domain-containing protein [Acidobacteria bacterium AB60]
MKDIYISALSSFEEGKLFDSFFLVLSRQNRTTQTNKPYLNFVFCDKTGQLEGRVWDPADQRIARDIERGDIVKARGCVTRYNDRLQMKVEQLRRAYASEVEKSDLMPATTYNIDELWARLLAFVDSFTDPDLKRLLTTIFADPQIAGAFREAPAAKQLHHAWLGGLLEHVVSLLTLADRIAPHYPLVHRDLLLTGVILHDIGKLRELSWDVGFDYTLDGVLLGHIAMGASLAERTMDALPGFPPKLKTLVLHLVLSHHGKLEFGSPKMPMTPEALALSFIDDLDAKMQAMASEFEKNDREGKGPEELTGKVWALDQRQLLNTRRWLADSPQPAAAETTVEPSEILVESAPAEPGQVAPPQQQQDEPSLFQFLDPR